MTLHFPAVKALLALPLDEKLPLIDDFEAKTAIILTKMHGILHHPALTPEHREVIRHMGDVATFALEEADDARKDDAKAWQRILPFYLEMETVLDSFITLEEELL